MSRLLTAVIAFGFAFGLNVAIGQTLESHSPRTSGEYKMTKESCKNPGEGAANQCLKVAKATEENPRARCEKLTGQDKRECILEAFVRQHDHMINGGQVENSEGALPGGSQPR